MTVALIDATALVAAAGSEDPAVIAEAVDAALKAVNVVEIVRTLAVFVSIRLGPTGTANLIEVVATSIAEQEGFTE